MIEVSPFGIVFGLAGLFVTTFLLSGLIQFKLRTRRSSQ